MEMTAGTTYDPLAGVDLQTPFSSNVSAAALPFPYNAVVLIETKNPADPSHFTVGTGVVIGPHSVLTASHVLWDSTHQSEANQVWLYPSYSQNGYPNPAGSGAPISASLAWHNYLVGNVGSDTISASDSQNDFAVIDTSYTFSTWMNALLEYSNGTVHMTGYPSSSNGLQTDTYPVNVTKDPTYSLLNYPNGTSQPGNSGGPLWVDDIKSVVGIVSSTQHAAQLTVDKWLTILDWEEMDSYLWGGPTRPLTVTGAGDFNSNGNPDFFWGTSYYSAIWEYNPSTQHVSTTNLGSTAGWGVVSSAHFISASTSQMLMVGPTGLMTLWWVASGKLTGINLGQRWINVSFVGAGQFTTQVSNTQFLVGNNTDHHLYDWWITPQNQLSGIDLGPYWGNVSLITSGQFTANGGTNFLVSDNTNHHLYDWWISGTTLQGIDLGPYWGAVQLVTVGRFDTRAANSEFLVQNPGDHHLYEWWIGANNALTGVDLGAYWGNVQLVTAGRFDSNSSNTELLVQNTIDHHLYEWWITASGQLTGIDLGPYWSGVQLIGNSHYNGNSAFNELLVRNTGDGHFYEWWTSGNRLQGVDLGASPSTAAVLADNPTAAPASSAADPATPITAVPSAAMTAATLAAVGPAPAAGAVASAGAVDPTGAASSIAGSPALASAPQPAVLPPAADTTALLVQAMAAFGANGASADTPASAAANMASPPPPLAATVEQHLAHA